MRRLCVGLHQTITERRYTSVDLDFGLCRGITAAAMLPVIPLIASYRERDGIDFRLMLPDLSELYRLFVNTGWAHLIQPSRFDLPSESIAHVPVRRFTTPDEQYEVADRLLEFLMRHISIERRSLSAFEWALNEIMDNVLSHADSPEGGFVQATQYEHAAEFIVADAGMGIPRSLGISDSAAALETAVSEGGTRDSNSNQGNGLFGAYELARVSRGQFEINSAFGTLYLDTQADKRRARNASTPLDGTAVRCRIDTRESNLLEAALRFEGRQHKPLYDYTERTFETESGEMVYSVRERAARDLGSRSGGVRVRRQIENLLSDQDHVVIDFADVNVVSSSFADEVFGRLFVELGPRAFMTRIVLRNVDPLIDGLIDRAIVQRARIDNDPNI